MKTKQLLKIFLGWQLLILVIVAVSAWLLPLRSNFVADQNLPLLNFRSNFDGIHYISIAANGYQFGEQAFFPLYPRVISLLLNFVNKPILVGSLISAISFFIGLIFFVRLVRMDYPGSTVYWTLICLLLFPTSFFFTIVYSEGLFFLLMILSFYYARKQNWLLSGIFGALGSYTRIVGIILLPALFIEFWQSKPKTILKSLPLFIIPLGLLTYMYYLFRTTGDPLAFYHLQTVFAQSRSLKIILPYQVIWRYLKMVITVSKDDFIYLTIWLEFIIGIVFIFMSVWSFIKQRLSYAVFSASAFLLPTLTGNFASLPRYVLVCFPIFIAIGHYLSRHPRFRYLYLGVSLIGLITYLSLFARGYWVA